MRLGAFCCLARGEAGGVALLFLDVPDNVGFFHSDNPDAMFNGNLFDFSECHVFSPFFIDSGGIGKGFILTINRPARVVMQYGPVGLIAVRRFIQREMPRFAPHCSKQLRV